MVYIFRSLIVLQECVLMSLVSTEETFLMLIYLNKAIDSISFVKH